MMPKSVREAFNNLCYPDKPLVWVATSDEDQPHLVPVCFVKALDEDSLLIGNVFIKQTVRNVAVNPKIALGVAFKQDGWDGFLLKGRARVLRDGILFSGFKKEVLERSNGKRVLESALLMDVDSVYSLKPRGGGKRL
jgi:predicted pyridoxine 5'-phosphate oxidase superfamily flavin-nucleotide-binding protein